MKTIFGILSWIFMIISLLFFFEAVSSMISHSESREVYHPIIVGWVLFVAAGISRYFYSIIT
jgi:hypothetical protein